MGMVSLFDKYLPETMAEHGRTYHQPHTQGPKASKKFVHQIKSKYTYKLVLQWDRLILKQGVLHRLYIYNDVEYQQLVLPIRYHHKILTTLHDNMGHQGNDQTLDLLRERVYWPSMAHDTQAWVTNCHWCQTANGNYMEPKPKIIHLEANNRLDLICLDSTKIDLSCSGKENVIVITDAFTKFSIAVCTPNQTSKTIAKVLVKNGFMSVAFCPISIVTRVSVSTQTS